jgi:periplasmic protein TonB
MNPQIAEKQSHAPGDTWVLPLEQQKPLATRARAAQPAAEYKKHSLAAGYFGDIALSPQALRPVAVGEAQATFLRGLLDLPTEHKEWHPFDWVISLAIHVVIVAAVVIVPLAFTQVLDLRNFQLMYLTMPKPPAAAPPPAPAVAQAVRHPVQLKQNALVAPVSIPRNIAVIKDEAAPAIDTGGVIGGVPGGESGGVLGGIIGGTGTAPAPPPPAAAATKKIYRVGGEVKEPRPVSIVQPDYPPIARAAHAQGVVVIDAVINENGDIVQAHVVSGPGLLVAAALRAVAQWKYEPTILDGTPVPIEMQVQVHFSMH